MEETKKLRMCKQHGCVITSGCACEGLPIIPQSILDSAFTRNQTRRLKEDCSADLSTTGKAEPDIESNSRPPFPTTQKTSKTKKEELEQ